MKNVIGHLVLLAACTRGPGAACPATPSPNLEAQPAPSPVPCATAGAVAVASAAGDDCPTSCDDGNACTADTQSKGSGACSLACAHKGISACVKGDGCCPPSCTGANDPDCTSTVTASIPDDRRTKWKPGVPGGIPARTQICGTVDAQRFGDGVTDATQAIQSAIDACPLGQVVKLPAGKFRTKGSLAITRGVTLRGAGPGKTRILLDNPAVPVVIEIGVFANWSNGVAVRSGLAKGSTALVVDDASRFATGDLVLIDQIDDPNLVTTGDCTYFKRMEGGKARSVGQIFEVSSKDGNTIKISSPLHFTFSPKFAPQLVRMNNAAAVKSAGVEDLSAARVSEYRGQGFIVHFIHAAHSWLKNVETEKVSGRHVGVEASYAIEVRDGYYHHAWNYNPGANAYGVALSAQTSDSLVENNAVYYLNLPIDLENSGGGNVIAYNYVDDSYIANAPGWQMAAINSHCSFSHMELIEGNHAAHFGVDNVHGGAGYLTYYRNYASAVQRTVKGVGNVESFEIGANARYINVLGNVLYSPTLKGSYDMDCKDDFGVFAIGFGLTTDRCAIDERVRQTLLRHGNFDFVNNKTMWDPKIADRNLAPSLYLTAKPAFFGNRPWPYVDPDRNPRVGTLPAKERFDAAH